MYETYVATVSRPIDHSISTPKPSTYLPTFDCLQFKQVRPLSLRTGSGGGPDAIDDADGEGGTAAAVE